MAKKQTEKKYPSKNPNWSVFSTPSAMRSYAKKMIARWNKRFIDNRYEMPKHFAKLFDVEFANSWGDDGHLKDTQKYPENMYTVCIVRALNVKKLPMGERTTRTIWYGVSKRNPIDQDRPEVGRKLAFGKAFRQMLEDCYYWEYVNPQERKEQELDTTKLRSVASKFDTDFAIEG